jgi:ClpP class serine protease
VCDLRGGTPLAFLRRGEGAERAREEAGLTEWLWLVFVVLAVQPMIRQRLLEAMRARLIGRIEQQRGSRVISLVHRQETVSFLGIPVLRYIDVDDSEQILRAIHLTDRELPIDLVLHTPGGLALASTQIARALARHPGRVTVFVPHYAMSGGTLIALAADEIVMSEHAVLGPADPQVGGAPAASILRAVERKPIAEVDDETLILADQSEMALNQLRQTIHDLTAATRSRAISRRDAGRTTTRSRSTRPASSASACRPRCRRRCSS